MCGYPSDTAGCSHSHGTPRSCAIFAACAHLRAQSVPIRTRSLSAPVRVPNPYNSGPVAPLNGDGYPGRFRERALLKVLHGGEARSPRSYVPPFMSLAMLSKKVSSQTSCLVLTSRSMKSTSSPSWTAAASKPPGSPRGPENRYKTALRLLRVEPEGGQTLAPRPE